MGIQNLQAFIEANCPNACVPVDLLKISRGLSVGRRVQHSQGGGAAPNRAFNNRLYLVIDGECCLDRLYGGFYSDWACGGQWNRMLQFLTVLVQTMQTNDIEIVVFFNGSLEPQRMDEWIKQQIHDRKKINMIMKHINVRAIPPPKVWWLPPVCLRSCLRMALRNLGVPVFCSMDDHHQEVIAYCRENYSHGVVAEDAEYAIFDPPRYFSSEQLKLTYKGCLETKEIVLPEVAKELDLHPKKFCVLAALLGNYLLKDEDLISFYQSLAQGSNKLTGDALIKAVIAYVRDLPSADDVDAIGAQVFGSGQNSRVNQERIRKFRECVQYYLNGTKDGFLRYRPPAHQGRRQDQTNANQKPASQPKITIKQKEQTASQENKNGAKADDDGLPSEVGKFASETEESEKNSLSAYREATVSAPVPAPEIVIEPPNGQQSQDQCGASASTNDELVDIDEKANNEHLQSNGTNLLNSSSTSSSSSDSSPSRVSPDVASWKKNNKKDEKTNDGSTKPNLQLPKIPPEVMRTASERHQKGLMNPWIYQILTQGEIKIGVSLEDEVPKELPSGVLLYRPLRQMVYAILYNIHHSIFMAKQMGKSQESVESVNVKEWVWSKENAYKTPNMVSALQLGWGVPTVQRLWFGSVVDDKRRRMRAFLTCMRSDTSLMLKTCNVPQHLLILCCVLKYMLSDKSVRVLRKQELDAFLAQAISPQLMDAQGIQLMQLPLVTNRGIKLASLFMQGVEHALFANDACGAPIPLLMCCVWLFFDGKLFHEKLLKAESAKNLSDICDGHMDQVIKVERMRSAILEGLNVQFAIPPIGIMRGGGFNNVPPSVPVPPPQPPSSINPMGRGRGGKKMLARGGQLEIAGVVVGSWGANYGQVPARSRGLPMAPSMPAPRRPGGMNVGRGCTPGYNNRYVHPHGMPSGPGRRHGGAPSYHNKGNRQAPRKNKKNDKNSKTNNSYNRPPGGRGCTLETSRECNKDFKEKVVKIQNGHADEKFEDAVENGVSSQTSPATNDENNKSSKTESKTNDQGPKSVESGTSSSVKVSK